MKDRLLAFLHRWQGLAGYLALALGGLVSLMFVWVAIYTNRNETYRACVDEARSRLRLIAAFDDLATFASELGISDPRIQVFAEGIAVKFAPAPCDKPELIPLP